MKPINAAEFVEENLKTIFAYALSRVKNKDDAEDLTNDIVLAILQSETKLKDENAFYGYVWGIAANTYRKFVRKKVRNDYDELSEESEDGSDFTEGLLLREDVKQLHREIALLTKEYRECTIAYYFDELSCAEVSKRLGISLEMVKYYLFKTRKILKEGISMEREFGEKSFKPAPFEFVTIFSGEFNREYKNLFARKLPGQILMAAYYTPMTTRELVIELGVSSVYLEDELGLLEKYGLITKNPAGKYQTKLLIYTDDFVNEFRRTVKGFAIEAMGEITNGLKAKLPQVKRLNRICAELSDERLIWGLLWPVIRNGYVRFCEAHPELQEKSELYDGAAGTNYGVSVEEIVEEWESQAFAGYAGIDADYYGVFADFGVLPEKNRCSGVEREELSAKIRKVLAGEQTAEFMIFTEAEEAQMLSLIASEIEALKELYERMHSCACKLMQVHAPKSMESQIAPILFQTLFFRTVGFIGNCAVLSGALELPASDGPISLYVRTNSKEAEETCKQACQM